MQTFLPYTNFQKSARCLDYRRLGKQRVEAKQIFLSIVLPKYGWKNHPAIRMWKPYPETLLRYGQEICIEWRRRGYKDSLLEFFRDEIELRCPAYIFISSGTGDYTGGDSNKTSVKKHKSMKSEAHLSLANGQFTLPKWLNEKLCSSHRSNLLRKNYKYYSQFNWSEDEHQNYVWPS